MLRNGPGFFVEDSLVDPVPGLSLVFAAANTVATGSGEEATTIAAVNHYRRSQRTFSLKARRTKPISVAIGLCPVEAVLSAYP
jgi:hypothetical protein